MHMRLTADRPDAARHRSRELLVRTITIDEAAMWAETSARGWGETPELIAFIRDIGAVSVRARGTVCFLAEWNGEPIGAAALNIHDGVAVLAGASTDPAFRGRGAQAALLDARLRHAVAVGCDIGMMGALPGSASQRNGERQGYRIAYTRIKWQQRSSA
jgi:GNAT superfamily N-acetyltransferase